MTNSRTRRQEGWLNKQLAKRGIWQANWNEYVLDHELGVERRRHRAQSLGSAPKMKKYHAEEQLAKIVAALNSNQGRVPQAEIITLRDFIKERWQPLHAGNWEESSTLKTNEQILTRITDHFGDRRLDSMDKVELQEWLNHTAKRYSRSTVWHLRTYLKSIFAEAVDQEFLSRDPSRKLKRPKTRKPDSTILDWKDYQAIVIELANSSILHALILKVAAVAPRPEEIFAFRWSSFIQLSNGKHVLSVRETVYRNHLRPFAKTRRSEAYLAVPDALALELKFWRRISKHAKDNDFIFSNKRGGFITKDNFLSRVLYPVRDKLKLEKLNFQILRRTFASLAQSTNIGSLADVAAQLRNDKATALENYTKTVPAAQFAMVESVYSRMFTNGKQTVQ